MSYYIHHVGAIVALDLTDRWNCQIPKRQAQSASNAFYVQRFSPSIPPKSGLRQENNCKCTT